jgi:O-antigen ligase
MLAVILVISFGAIWLIATLVQGDRIAWHPLFLPMAAFLAWTGTQWAAGWTVNAHATAYEWTRYLSYVVVFVLTTQVCRQGRRARGVVRALAATGIAVGIFGLSQFLTWNGRMYWFYDPPYEGNPFGPFNNRNYFAGYMIVTMATLLALLFSRGLRRNRWAFAYLGWLACLSLLVSLSRGGALALAVVLGTTILLGPMPTSKESKGGRERLDTGPARSTLGRPAHRRAARPSRSAGDKRFFGLRIRGVSLSARTWLVIAVMAALLIGLSGLQQTDRVIARLETMWEFDTEVSVQSRWTIWRGAAAMIADRPLRGFGLNTFGWVLPRYQIEPTSLIFMHAHNEYIEVVAETGVIGGILCLWFLVVFFRETWRRLRASRQPWERGVHLAGLAAWVGILAFAMTDFPTIIPAIDYALAVLAAVATTAIEPTDRTQAAAG